MHENLAVQDGLLGRPLVCGMQTKHEPGVGKYVGQLNANDERHGRGRFTFANGGTHDGNWKDGNPHGRGVRVYANGDTYDGEWKDDTPHGHGVCTDVNGVTYDGEWENGVPHGRGVCISADGVRHAGEWKDGEWKDDNSRIVHACFPVRVCKTFVCHAICDDQSDGDDDDDEEAPSYELRGPF